MKNVILLVSASMLYSCSTGKVPKESNNGFFEGEIVYNIDYQPYSGQFTTERLKEYVGSKMILTFKDGSSRKRYYSSSGDLLNERFLAIEEDKSYMKSVGNDTIYWFDVTKPDSKTIFRQIKDSIIIGEPCIGIDTETIVTGVGFGEKTFNVSGAYYYAKNLNVDPEWYTNYREGNFNEIIKIGKGIHLLSVDKSIYWEQTITATSIVKRSITTEEVRIAIPPNAILKEM